jgi:pimeloyl-ACP methyl ester carboxylesterase
MPLIKARDGAPLHYTIHDYTDRWRTPSTIILVHGFARSGEFWFNMVPYLARFFRVITVDLRGLGQSVPLQDPKTVTIDSYVDDLLSVAHDAGAETFHIVGESIGGAISLVFAGRQPGKLRTVSVIAPAIFANEWIRNAYAVGYPTWEGAIRDLGVEGWARKSNALARFPKDTDPAFPEWYSREVGKADTEVVCAMVNFAATVDARPYLPKITAPVLALYPTSGTIATKEQSSLLTDNISDVRISYLRSPYQMLGLLHPADCAQQILNFAALNDGFVARE